MFGDAPSESYSPQTPSGIGGKPMAKNTACHVWLLVNLHVVLSRRVFCPSSLGFGLKSSQNLLLVSHFLVGTVPVLVPVAVPSSIHLSSQGSKRSFCQSCNSGQDRLVFISHHILVCHMTRMINTTCHMLKILLEYCKTCLFDKSVG